MNRRELLEHIQANHPRVYNRIAGKYTTFDDLQSAHNAEHAEYHGHSTSGGNLLDLSTADMESMFEIIVDYIWYSAEAYENNEITSEEHDRKMEQAKRLGDLLPESITKLID